jgi:hypothetical protein
MAKAKRHKVGRGKRLTMAGWNALAARHRDGLVVSSSRRVLETLRKLGYVRALSVKDGPLFAAPSTAAGRAAVPFKEFPES